ncbi:patatin-like protein [Erythrobacter sp. 3-20A1M]|uniref:patatin-like protein n=1 Tax=Erythrobacter sp. 3-20A1M TaxID=2653850 RepID=UPI001BFC0EA3|nr:patatin-like protein [Erythrobacter sp. 3-20A1M]QWC58160.1 patatin-like protein [Erythrobacter sp. 3-20A1M]
MRQKELRIALVCYGGVSLAVYMHGVTKEVWHLAQASRDHHSGADAGGGITGVYRDLIRHCEEQSGLRLRILPDILSGASAGGINAVFLSQAIFAGYSLDPLTELWLESADVDRLFAEEARPGWRFAKFWAQPLAEYVLRRPGNAVSESVAPETRSEVREKVSRLIRGRWFAPPFSGAGMSRLIWDALQAMAQADAGPPLLPPGHPLDLYVTTTDFRGYLAELRLNSPPVVQESEHRLPISFTADTPAIPGMAFADPLELTFAARATSSFPGAFPPLRVPEIDALAKSEGAAWQGRDAFLLRIMPTHSAAGVAESVSLIDGSVLVNRPFEGAIEAQRGRPAHREVDRRFVYIDPRPDRVGSLRDDHTKPVGFFGAIFGSLSTIPREQPIRDNLEALAEQSREAERLARITRGLRPEVEAAIERLFGRTLFLDNPNPRRLRNWRNRAQQAAAERAGYAFQAYAQAKFDGIVERLARLICDAADGADALDPVLVGARLRIALQARGLDTLAAPGGGANDAAIAFFRQHDLDFRVRRLRTIARRLSREWEADPEIDDAALDHARERVYDILALYFDREGTAHLGEDFPALAQAVFTEPGAVLERLEQRHLLPSVDEQAEALLAEALQAMPTNLRRRTLLTYLGFPFYDVATLTLIGGDGQRELNPVKVDRISPDDARSIRPGGTRSTLRGIEFYNFGAFFSRAYRENDYLWGRLHGAERLIDIVLSTMETDKVKVDSKAWKRRAFLAILDEERGRLRANPRLISTIEAEIEARLGPA